MVGFPYVSFTEVPSVHGFTSISGEVRMVLAFAFWMEKEHAPVKKDGMRNLEVPELFIPSSKVMLLMPRKET